MKTNTVDHLDMNHEISSHPSEKPVRLLIPIDATDQSRWGLKYASRLASSGTQLEVNLLFVAEPVRRWEVLRFYTEAEVAQHFHQRAVIFLEQAEAELIERGVSCRSFFREADSVGGVIDVAEELNCSEIVVPKIEWLGIFSSGLGQKLMNRRCNIPVKLINADGSASEV